MGFSIERREKPGCAARCKQGCVNLLDTPSDTGSLCAIELKDVTGVTVFPTPGKNNRGASFCDGYESQSIINSLLEEAANLLH